MDLEIVRALVWPVVVLILGLLYLFRRGSVLVQIPGGTVINLSCDQAGKKLSELFAEFHKEYDTLLKVNHKQFFRLVLAHGGTPMVKELLPDFNHEDEKQIGMLRALRGLGLIAPVEGGTWRPECHIVVTDFGKALTAYMKDNL